MTSLTVNLTAADLLARDMISERVATAQARAQVRAVKAANRAARRAQRQTRPTPRTHRTHLQVWAVRLMFPVR